MAANVVFSPPCRCAAPPSLELDSLFCERVEQFWHLEYLDNYLCCTRAQLPVLTSAQCRDPGHSDPSTWTWSPWSSWGACQRVVTSIEVASVKRRYYLQYLGYLQYLLSTVSTLYSI